VLHREWRFSSSPAAFAFAAWSRPPAISRKRRCSRRAPAPQGLEALGSCPRPGPLSPAPNARLSPPLLAARSGCSAVLARTVRSAREAACRPRPAGTRSRPEDDTIASPANNVIAFILTMLAARTHSSRPDTRGGVCVNFVGFLGCSWLSSTLPRPRVPDSRGPRLEFMLGVHKADWLAARLEDLDYGDIDGICAAARVYPLEAPRKKRRKGNSATSRTMTRGCATSGSPPAACSSAPRG